MVAMDASSSDRNTYVTQYYICLAVVQSGVRCRAANVHTNGRFWGQSGPTRTPAWTPQQATRPLLTLKDQVSTEPSGPASLHTGSSQQHKPP